MTILVVGATGATGRLLVGELLERGERVKAIVRSPGKLPEHLRNHDLLSIIHADLPILGDDDLRGHVAGCTAIASCLGHNLTFNGMYGHPRRLVTDAVRRLCDAVRADRSERPVRVVLMNTAGNRNRDLDEHISFAERCVVALIRLLLPPHKDNEEAADYLRCSVGRGSGDIEWVAVRPDTLVDEGSVTGYEVHRSPTRSAIFNAGRTSRINVAHFMADLAMGDEAWERWNGQMPVIYNEGFA